MKIRNLFVLPVICCALALTLGACGDGKQENAEAKAKALRKAADEAGLILSEDGKTVTGVKDKSIKSVVIPNGVTSIGDYAFNGCRTLTSVMIPDSITSIGDYAFNGCRTLTSVVIPDSVTSIGKSAFRGCYKLTSVTLPDSVTSIGAYAFSDCSSLTSITIPDSVTGIGKYAFEGIKTVTCSPVFETLPDGTLINKKHKALVCVPENVSGNYTIPSSVTSIGDYAFNGCCTLTSVTIPDSVTTIGDAVFIGVRSVRVSTENPVYSVDERGVLINKKEKKLLYAPPSLSGSYTIPAGVTSIEDYAFNGCRPLTSVTIPDSVTSVGDSVFAGCKNLTSVVIPDSVTSIGKEAFEGCSSLTSITIPDSVTSIGDYAFNGCRTLTSVVIPDSVTSIGDYAFNGCHTLTSVTIPDSVTSIGDYAFNGCHTLTSVTIPDSVTTIGDAVFIDVRSVRVSTENPVYSVDERGVLINKKEKKLLYALPAFPEVIQSLPVLRALRRVHFPGVDTSRA